MGKRSLIIFLGFILYASMYLSACENPGASIEESVLPYLELEAVDGASNATMTVNRGHTHGLDSYFSFEIADVTDNEIVREGLTEGWCLEWDKPIAQNNDVHRGIDMYSTYGSNTWKPANYLMNIKNELKAADPNITYKEIQVALWSLIDTPEFDLDKVLATGRMPSRLMSNGQPNFSVKKTKEIIDKVRSESADFNYGFGSNYFVFANTNHDDQNGGHTTTKCGETAWSDGGRYIDQGNWATYTPYGGVEKTVTLFAGQDQDIGTVTFSAPVGGIVTITIEMNSNGGFQNVSENVKIQDYATMPSGNPSPGGFDHKASVTPGTTSYSIDVPENDFYGVHIDALSAEGCEEDS